MDINDSAVAASDPEADGGRPDALTGDSPSDSGHGTFIAGLLAQGCPSAEIAALRVMNADGVVPEHVLTNTISALVDYQHENPGWADALVMSLGYYSESSADVTYTTGLSALLATLCQAGVAVFCAAGNDSTSRECYPAAFASTDAFTVPGLPLASVGALNPDGSVALFSNDGTWVTDTEYGANVVSTMPISQHGAWQPDVDVHSSAYSVRATIGPEWFPGGFAAWSGTSFAAPVAAGRYLARLVAAGCPKDPHEQQALVPHRAALNTHDHGSGADRDQ
jgi:subtilisin family serine protease